MTYEIYRYIFIGGAILAGIMLAVAVLLFFLFHIPAVLGELTGATAKKAIAQIRNQNEQTGENAQGAASTSKKREKLTDRISPSGRLLHAVTDIMDGAALTEKISTDKLAAEAKEGTTVLEAGYESPETTALEPGYESPETTVLEAGYESPETTVLEPERAFAVEFEITYLFSDEEVV